MGSSASETTERAVDDMVEHNRQVLDAKASLLLASSMNEDDVKNHSIRADNVMRQHYIKAGILVLGVIVVVLVGLKIFFP